MGVVAYYARVNEADLETLRRDPEQFWKLSEMPWDLATTHDAAASERLYVDKDWQVLSWLCSDMGRAEERYSAALMDVDMSIEDPEAFKTAIAKQVEAMGFQYIDPREMPNDPVLSAMQGRRDGGDGKALGELGLGSAVFTPTEAGHLASALGNLSESWLRERFDVAEMEALCLPADCEESELDEFYLPQLTRIQTLYNRAAAVGQHVVVVMS